ncbi:hypothetical protein [Sphingomonas adhaesiva]|uniref:hypothetical protein n=1 Tax=Sphingomonas adhaesiva TaxID=28212 RepID=UPI002FFAA594
MSDVGEVLTGTAMIALGSGAAVQASDAYGGAMMTVAGLLGLLSAQEAERAAAWRAADIAAMRALLPDAAVAPATDLTLTALDVEWAALSDALIAHHAAVEAAGDIAQDRAILQFYRESAARREFLWPQ